MNVKGTCKIYIKDAQGRINTNINNALNLNARNVLVDMLGQAQEGTIGNIEKIFYMRLTDLTDTPLTWVAANSATSSTDADVSLPDALQTVSGNNITVAISQTYAAISTDSAKVTYTVVVNPGCFTNGQSLEKISMIAKFSSGTVLDERVFSSITLNSPITIVNTNTYTFIYEYTITA